jgi:hypothetical protein
MSFSSIPMKIFHWFCAISPEVLEHSIQFPVLLIVVQTKGTTKSHAF